MIRLSDLDYHTHAVIRDIRAKDDGVSIRMADMGVLSGVTISPLFRGLSGGIKAYGIGDRMLAIRDRDAGRIFVEEIRLE